ncbi:hypothetical protein C0J52_11097 [Blattella germanica]|nr:hypothetical protein C0J52_11097 [Blattella germanica]
MSSVDCTSSTMADVHEENNANPFVTSSSLRRSPPPSTKHSPRSSSQGPSPSDSPRARSKLSMVNQVRDNCSPRDGSGEASPRSRSGKNSPDRRISSNRLASMEGSPKNSINAEINQSEAGPDIAEDAHLQSGDVFKDPAAFDFLNSIGNSNTATDLRKESLYVKFDPLIGSRTVDHSVPLPPAVEAKSNNITMPAVTSSPRELHINNTTPPRNDAISVVDKLISLSPSPRRQQQIVTPVKHEEPDNSAMVEELYLLREILAKQDEKHREDILKLQHQIECLQAKLKENEEREAGLNKKVAEKAQGQKQMSIIMEEYEKTISRLVAEKEEERQAHELDKSSLAKERDTAMGHLGNIEIAFSDLHKKYERSKTVIEGFKKNEEVLRASLAEYEATIRKQEQKYDVLKSHAMAQLENANQELDSVRRSQQAEAAKLKAMLKKAEVKTSSLEEMLEQKVKENQELASICDELINKVGSSQ